MIRKIDMAVLFERDEAATLGVCRCARTHDRRKFDAILASC